MSAAYRTADVAAVMAALRARRLRELEALELTHAAVVDVHARRALRVIFGAVLIAATVALGLVLSAGAAPTPTAVAGAWIAALVLAAVARQLAPVWLRAALERRFLEEDDVIALEAETAGEAARAAARRLERLSIAAPIVGVVMFLPPTLPVLGGVDLARVVTGFGAAQLLVAALASRFAARLAQLGNPFAIWRDGWAMTLWFAVLALLTALFLSGFVPPAMGMGTLLAAVIAVPWLAGQVVGVVARERDRLG